MLTLAMVCSMINTIGQYKKTYAVSRDSFPSGQLQRITEVWTVLYTKMEIDEHHKSRKTQIVEYFETGERKSITKKHYKVSTWGRPCNEVLYEHKDYYKNGHLKKLTLKKCDNHKEVVKEYDEHGRLARKKVTRTRWLKPKEK